MTIYLRFTFYAFIEEELYIMKQQEESQSTMKGNDKLNNESP